MASKEDVKLAAEISKATSELMSIIADLCKGAIDVLAASKRDYPIYEISEVITRLIRDARKRGVEMEALEFAKFANHIEKKGLVGKEFVKVFRKMAIVYSISKDLENKLKLDASGDVQKQICDHTPLSVKMETLADAIIAVWVDDVDIHLALAAARANDVRVAYDIRDAMKE